VRGAFKGEPSNSGPALLPILLGIPAALLMFGCLGCGLVGLLANQPSPATPQFTTVGANLPPAPNANPVRPGPNANPAPPRVEPEAAPLLAISGDAAVDRLLADLDSNEPAVASAAGHKLASMPPNDKREAVAKHVATRVEQANDHRRTNLVRALCVWGTRNEVPTFIAILDDQKFERILERNEVLKVIGNLQDARVVPAVVKCFVNVHSRGPALKALRELGPLAEGDVLALLEQMQHRRDAIVLLKDIGTPRSIPALQAIADRKEFAHAPAARQAIAAINARSKK
jgi:hypothetical protein